MERIWLNSYPPGVPADVDVTAFHSLVDLFDKSVARYAGKTAYLQMGARLSYGEVERLSRALAAFLQNRLGLEKGARVALMTPNILQFPVALFGALRAGCVVVACNPLYTPRELARQLRDSGAKAIVILDSFAPTLEEALPHVDVEHVIVTQLGDLLGFPKRLIVNFYVSRVKRLAPRRLPPGAIPFRRALKAGEALALRAEAIAPEDVALLQYTGGTTGAPKGAALTHGNLVANLQQHHAFIGAALRMGEDVVLTAIPLFHIYALTVSCLLPFKIGAANVLVADPRDIDSIIEEFARNRITCFAAVNRLFAALVDRPAFQRLDFSSLTISASGGSPLQEKVAAKWRAVTGKTLIEAYGLTESSPVVSCNPVDLACYNGSCGLPLPSTDISIRDDNDVELGVGAVGELCVRGPQVMKAYWNRPQESADAMTADGFLRTGDIATIDAAGYLRIVDRKKDMINVSGLKVYPNEVEEVVAAHPGVAEVAAVGVPDERSGEKVKIVVVRRDPLLCESDLQAFCRDRLAAYKIPRVIEFREALPRTAMGKSLRRALRMTTAAEGKKGPD